MKRKSSNVAKRYYVKPNKRRRSSFSSELSHAGGSRTHSARTDGGWNYSRGIVSGTAGLVAAAVTENPYAGNLAYSGTSALFGTQSNSMAGGTTGHVPFAPTTTRAGKRVKNKKAVKFSYKKVVKVSKRLRKKIEKVLVAKMVIGHVKQIYTGAIGAFEGQPNETATLSMGGLTSLRGVPAASNSQYVWQTMYNADLAGIPTYNVGTDFRLFSAPRILDAASILWNNKTPALDYSVTAGNFHGLVDANGVPTYDAAKTGGGPQIMVVKAKATFVFKNNSQRTHYLKMLVCKSKRVANGVSPLDTWAAGMGIETADASNATQFNNQTIIFGPTATASGLEPAIPVSVIGAMPNISKSFQSTWKYETVEMCIEPGQIVTQVVHGPRHQEYDWSRLYTTGTSTQLMAYPKFDRWVMFVGNLDLVTDSIGRVGHHFGVAGATDDKRLIAVEMTLDTVLAMPESTGFLGNTGAGTANTMQPLNARRPRNALLNFTNSINATYSDVARVDDENPVDTTVG